MFRASDKDTLACMIIAQEMMVDNAAFVRPFVEGKILDLSGASQKS